MTPIQARNLSRASVLHPDLQRLVSAMDAHGLAFALTTTHRGATDQNAAHKGGFSNAAFGKSPHNFLPALAFDAYPLINGTVDVNDARALDDFAPKVMAIAKELDLKITWGGSWHTIIDRPHFELSDWRAMHGASA